MMHFYEKKVHQNHFFQGAFKQLCVLNTFEYKKELTSKI